MKFKPTDQIKITAGKDRGKTGEISKVFPKKGTVIVKGANLYKRHLKSRDGVQGGIYSIERPLPTAKIALICPTCKKTTRIGYSTPQQGQKVRICKKCLSPITLPQKTTKKARK